MISAFEISSLKKTISAAMWLLAFTLLTSFCFGQQLTGTLSGTVYDSAGAAVPNAKVSLKNESSGDIRDTVSNGVGYFSITAVQPGSYTVNVEAPGFKAWEQNSITMSQGESHSISNIKLQVGQVSETVEIKAGADVVIPDNSEVSTTLNTELIEDIPIVGRDAGELLKVMPGMALTNGTAQGSGFNDKVVGTNNGPVGAYSANGTQPYGAMAYMLDGANLVDPGNAGTQIANINQDMVSEVKVLMSSYSAEYAKGPVIFQAFSKSGGNQFHGEGYLYARNSALNSDDAYAHSQGIPNSLEHYYYGGGNIGGPIIIPGTDFNKSRKKLFFWGGYEYMDQHPAAAPINYNVPTTEQLSGDFSETTIDGVPGSTPVSTCGSNKTLLSCLGSGSIWQYAYSIPYGLPSGGKTMPTSDYDPNIGGIAALFPKPNISPAATNGWNNYQYISQVPQNRWEATGKVDYAISDNTKLTGSYTRQIENDQHPVGVWWTPPWTLPYPSNVVAATTSQEVMANLTHVFSPTTTNEFVFTLARYINPSTLSNAKAVDRTALGFNVTGLFGHTTSQIPNFEGPWGGAFPNFEEFSFDGGFDGKAFGAIKRDPALYDNFTKVVGSHTLKAGFYWDTSENIQSSGGLGPGDNGTYNLGWGPNSSGNVVADFLLGRTGTPGYQQVSSFPTNDLKFHQWSIYAQDSFKANRQLTLNYGLRFDHVGQWYGTAQGFQVWNPAVYQQNTYGPTGLITAAPNNTGLQWHANTPSVPLSGMNSPLFYYEPRIGLAYDIFGTGKTILRSGFAIFHYQVSTQVSDAANGPEGAFTFNSSATTTGYAQIDCGPTTSTSCPNGNAGFVPPSAVAQNGATVYGLLPGDNKTPLTMDWNVTVSQALPWRSVFELSYVGNKSQNEWIDGGNGKVGDQNNVLPGGFFLPDPTGSNTGGATFGKLLSPNPPPCTSSTPVPNQALSCSGTYGPNYLLTFNGNDFRPLNAYQDVYLLYHGSFANYNSLQASWQKQSGPVNFLLNYTFSKVLGIRDGQTDNGPGNGTVTDPFSIRNNYGPLAYDHTHIFNASYVWNLPKFIHSHHLLEGAVNGWQLSGYTTYQSGAAFQPNMNGNLNAGYAGGLTVPTNALPDLPDNSFRLPNGLAAVNVSPQTWFGVSPDNSGFLLMPNLLCNPAKNLPSHHYFNPSCFGMPSYGQQGPLEWPYMRGPAYFDSDMALFKNFQITERQKVQFRISAVNWLNHPLYQFGLAGNTDQNINFQQNTTAFIPNSGVGSQGNECAYAIANSGATAVTGGCNVPVIAISRTNTSTATGKPSFKTGSRTLLFAVKYYF
jgi:hypothetical protein